MKQVKLFIALVIANWQTSLAGAAIIGIKVGAACGKIPAAVANDAVGLIGGLGLIAATDGTRPPAQQAIVATELQIAQDALAAAKAQGNPKLIEMAQAAVDALENPPTTGA